MYVLFVEDVRSYHEEEKKKKKVPLDLDGLENNSESVENEETTKTDDVQEEEGTWTMNNLGDLEATIPGFYAYPSYLSLHCCVQVLLNSRNTKYCFYSC